MIGNTALKAQNEMIMIDDMYYMDIEAYRHIKNRAKMEMIAAQRHEMRKIQMDRDARTEEQKIRRNVMIRQKKIGILMFFISLLLLIVSQEGFCIACMMVGLYATITDKVIVHDYNLAAWEESKNEKI